MSGSNSSKSSASTAMSGARRTALAAAVLLGEKVELPLLSALGADTATLEALFDEGLLLPLEGATARLSEAVDRDGALAALLWSERRRLQERTAALLADRADRAAEAVPLFLAACCYREARELLRRLAAAACEEKRYADAMAVLDQALTVWPADEEPEERLKMMREMVRCSRNCGRLDMTGKVLRALLDAASKSSDVPLALETHQQLADLALLETDFHTARRHLEAAAELAEKEADGAEAARRWFALASFLTDQVRPRPALEALQRAAALAGPDCDPALHSELLSFEGLVRAMLGEAEAARDCVERALAVAVAHRLNEQAALAYRRTANIREYCSNYTGERDAHFQVLALCRRQRETGAEQMCMVCLSYVFFRTGEWRRALETARDVSRNSDTHPALKAGALGVQAMVAAFRGGHRRTVALLEDSSLGMRRYGVLSLEFHLLWAKGFLLETSGDKAGAAAAYARLLDLWHETDDAHDVVPGAVSAAAFFRDAGDLRRVAHATDILHAVVAANDNGENRAARFAVLGEAAAGAGDPAEAILHFTASRDGYDRLGTPVERALVRRRLAGMLTLAGREGEAAVEREACAGIARTLGMRPVLASLSHSAAAAPASGGAARSEVLTARQHDVLRLLAAGLTNKEAADRLGLSPRTVEMHVAALLNRLNCRTRTEAMHRAGERGLLE